MLISTQAIVLSKIRYGDNDLIVKCYTKELGVVSFILRNILKSKKGHLKKAYFEPLSQLQIEILYKQKRALQTIKEVKVTQHYNTLHTNILKSTVVLFLSEILSNVLKEEEKNETLFDYLEASLLWFDTHDSIANFHLFFLLKLSKYLGFYPDTNHLEYDYFNMEAGRFIPKPNDLHVISGENLILLKQFLGTTFDDLNLIKISSSQRQFFLNMILLYFKLHLGSFRSPKSLNILNQVFN